MSCRVRSSILNLNRALNSCTRNRPAPFTRLLSTSSTNHGDYAAISRSNYVIEVNSINKQKQCCRQMCLLIYPSTIEIVDYKEVKELINQPEVTLIDVREPVELEQTGFIPTSTNIPVGDVETAFRLTDKDFNKKYNRKKPSKSDEIVFYCKAGIRSDQAATAVSKLGFKNVKNYKGSWLDWAKHENLPI